MLVATKVKLSMERLARLLINGTYGGKGSGDRQFEEMGGVVDRSIDCESTQCTRIQVSLLRRHVTLFLG